MFSKLTFIITPQDDTHFWLTAMHGGRVYTYLNAPITLDAIPGFIERIKQEIKRGDFIS